MKKHEFEDALRSFLPEITSMISDSEDNWSVKGFIDIYKNIYSITSDTKVISKLIEIMIFPVMVRFASENGLVLELSSFQNHYPDLTFIDRDGNKFAVDLKSTYRKNEISVNGFTLGAFNGYFRKRQSTKNIRFPYGDYAEHYVLGVIYTRLIIHSDSTEKYSILELDKIDSVAKSFKLFVQPKWKIASDKPGSGNTENIGSVTLIDDLIDGKGTFSEYGERVFDDYWMNFLTARMAKNNDSPRPFTNLDNYIRWRNNNPAKSFSHIGSNESTPDEEDS